MQTPHTLREHTFHPFDTDMGRLRGGVLRMAALVERQLVRAVKAGILQAQAQAAQVLAGDPAVHELHTEIDAQAGLTIARQQPAAIDLREIVSVFHIIDDLERIGQEARRIARRVQQSEASERLPGSARAEALADAVAQALRKGVVCAGFMRILGPAFVHRFAGRIVNTHPALLPSFPGAHGVRDAMAYGVKVTGCTVHLVDEGVDTGPILAQAPVAVRADDDEASLHERIKTVERELLVETVAALAAHGCTVTGRKVTIP